MVLGATPAVETEMADSPDGDVVRPNVLVFGGCGFVGRNLVHYLIENELVSFVRIVDKVPPQVAWLNKAHQAVFDDARVEFKSANLINAASCDQAFEGKRFQIAVNCASETKLGHEDEVYEEGVYQLSLNCATSAAKHGVDKFIEVSTGQMWSDKIIHSEDDEVSPWTTIARYKYKVEQELKSIANLNYSIIRPSIVYGKGDKSALGGRLLITPLYQELTEPLKLLWGEDLGMNTIHVIDLVRAIWHLATVAPDGLYLASDEGQTTQGLLMSTIGKVFGVEPTYVSSLVLSVCSVPDILAIADEANDRHAGPWANACRKGGVKNTPLSTFIISEQLLNRHIKLNNSKLKSTGFRFLHPQVTEELIRDIIEDYIAMNMFPSQLLP